MKLFWIFFTKKLQARSFKPPALPRGICVNLREA
jgi:hypothetical protein